MNGQTNASRAVIVTTKAPVPDDAKTRLIPALGAVGAANLASRLLEHAVAQALAAAPGPVALFVDMVWSIAIVMAVTRTRLRAAGMRYTGLAPFADIEEPADLVHLPAGWLAS